MRRRRQRWEGEEDDYELFTEQHHWPNSLLQGHPDGFLYSPVHYPAVSAVSGAEVLWLDETTSERESSAEDAYSQRSSA